MLHSIILAAAEPGSGVDAVFTAGQTELGASVPKIVLGIAAILGLAWAVRSVFIAQKAAKKASSHIGG